MRLRIWIWGGIAYLLLRGVLLTNPGYVGDIQFLKRWALAGAREGLSQIYRTSGMDYPPLYAYILTPLGHLYRLLDPAGFVTGERSTLDPILIKLPPLLFDLAIAGLAHRLITRYARPDRANCRWPFDPTFELSPAWWGMLLVGAYLLNPAVLFNHGYWGEPDSIHSFFVMAAFGAVFAYRNAATALFRAWPAWVLLTLATLMKPLGAPFFPLLLVFSLLVHGLYATVLGGLASLATVFLVFSPFIFTGQTMEVFQRVIGDVGAMPYSSVNAHNLWWLLGAWRNAEEPWLGLITATQIGLVLFGAVYVVLLWQAVRLHRMQASGIAEAQGMALACGVGFSFFMLSTHMHENHMFIVLPLSLLLISTGAWWRRFYVAASLAILLNLVLHDRGICERWPFTAGGPTTVMNAQWHRPFYVVELGSIWIATFFNLAIFGVFFFRVLKSGQESNLLEHPC